MDDSISRQAIMKEFADFVKKSNNSDFAQTPTWNDAVSLVESMPSVQRWIPVTEWLPESREEVIVSVCDETGDTKYNYVSHGWLTTDKEYWIVDNEINNYVVAWMPLPEPWRGRS